MTAFLSTPTDPTETQVGVLGVSSEHEPEGREGACRRARGQPWPHLPGQGVAAVLEAAGRGIFDEDPAQAQSHRREPLQGGRRTPQEGGH